MTPPPDKTLLQKRRGKSIRGQRALFDGGFVCCTVCGRKLKTEKSRLAGVGPACLKKCEG